MEWGAEKKQNMPGNQMVARIKFTTTDSGSSVIFFTTC